MAIGWFLSTAGRRRHPFATGVRPLGIGVSDWEDVKRREVQFSPVSKQFRSLKRIRRHISVDPLPHAASHGELTATLMPSFGIFKN